MKDLTLLIMAAGMGSRFGGLKQITPIGPNDEFIIDYSIYDAKRAGFNKIVFVIKEEIYDEFKKTIGSRIEPHIKVEYCFQDMDKLPNGYKFEGNRKKPWGTAHAIWAAKDLINENFAVINADDFYGMESYQDAVKFLKDNNDPNLYAIIGYEVDKTLTENGSVKRAILNKDGEYLTTLTESSVEKINGQIIAKPLEKDEEFVIPNNHPVSLNMFCFSSNIFNYIEDNFMDFINSCKDLETSEYLIPELVSNLVLNNKIKVKVIPTKAEWSGVTYREDLDTVVNRINSEINSGNYKNNLWG